MMSPHNGALLTPDTMPRPLSQDCRARGKTATKGGFQDKMNSENLDVQKDQNGYQLLSSCSASPTSLGERPVPRTDLQ